MHSLCVGRFSEGSLVSWTLEKLSGVTGFQRGPWAVWLDGLWEQLGRKVLGSLIIQLSCGHRITDHACTCVGQELGGGADQR